MKGKLLLLSLLLLQLQLRLAPSASIAMQASAATPECSLQHGVDAAAGIQDILKTGPAGRTVNLHLACVLTKLLHLLLSHEQHHRRRKLVREVLSSREDAEPGALLPLPVEPMQDTVNSTKDAQSHENTSDHAKACCHRTWLHRDKCIHQSMQECVIMECGSAPCN